VGAVERQETEKSFIDVQGTHIMEDVLSREKRGCLFTPIDAYHRRVSIIAPVCTALAVVGKVKCRRVNSSLVFRHCSTPQPARRVCFFHPRDHRGALAWLVRTYAFAAGALKISDQVTDENRLHVCLFFVCGI
jgi:hypothetical protein